MATVSAADGYVVMCPYLETSGVSTATMSPYLPPCTQAEVIELSVVFGNVTCARPVAKKTSLMSC